MHTHIHTYILHTVGAKQFHILFYRRAVSTTKKRPSRSTGITVLIFPIHHMSHSKKNKKLFIQ